MNNSDLVYSFRTTRSHNYFYNRFLKTYCSFQSFRSWLIQHEKLIISNLLRHLQYVLPNIEKFLSTKLDIYSRICISVDEKISNSTEALQADDVACIDKFFLPQPRNVFTAFKLFSEKRHKIELLIHVLKQRVTWDFEKPERKVTITEDTPFVEWCWKMIPGNN